MKIKLSQIKVPYNYKRTPPKKHKIEKHEQYFLANHHFKKPIVITENRTLIDGYIDYLLACKYEMRKVDVVSHRELKAFNDLLHKKSGYLIVTNGSHYINFTEYGKITKTNNIEEVQTYSDIDKLIEMLCWKTTQGAGYYIYDIKRNEICFSMPEKTHRKSFSLKQREMIYEKANGKCELCGKSILFDNMTLDHIKPLAMGGTNDISNVQCSCSVCNSLKGSILPEDFLDRITTIFMYQMEKKVSKKELEILKTIADN